jgi:hypothetical protein
MGDIELYLSKKHGPKNEGEQNQQLLLNYMRDPNLTDYENSLLHRPYCGNPFIAPGELGSKTARPKTKPGSGAPEDEEYFSFKFND